MTLSPGPVRRTDPLGSAGRAPASARPGRRRILQGVGLAATGFLLPVTRTEAGPNIGTDYPGARPTPASASNRTASTGPSARTVDRVVIHVTQETFSNTLGTFRNPAKAVSAHYVVRSADGYVGQCVRERDIAWHAGNWNFNTRSIGIEHEGWVDRPAGFTDAMYAHSAALTADVCERHGIPRDRTHIIGHVEVPGTDHTDPGPNWDWDRYIRMVELG